MGILSRFGQFINVDVIVPLLLIKGYMRTDSSVKSLSVNIFYFHPWEIGLDEQSAIQVP
jgi:hypothetical protein